VTVDQAHRGYTVAQDGASFASPNPLFWKPTPSDGKFSGQRTYGYQSFEGFVEAVNEVNAGKKKVSDFDGVLPTISTIVGTPRVGPTSGKNQQPGMKLGGKYPPPATRSELPCQLRRLLKPTPLSSLFRRKVEFTTLSALCQC